MRLDLTCLTERFLFGPDPLPRPPPVPSELATIQSATSSPTSENLSAIDSEGKHALKTATEHSSQDRTPEPRSDHEQTSSSASSPTLANPSPVESEGKQYCKVTTEWIASRTTTRKSEKPKNSGIAQWQTLWQKREATWHPTFLQIRPLVAIAALVTAIGCIFASLAILLVSDGQSVDNWPIPPSVYLAIVTAIANSSLVLAYTEATPVSWWYSISRGRSIRSLERQWQVTRSLLQAIAHIRHISLLHLACVAIAFVVIDGPLLQRASTVVRATQASNVTIDLNLLPELPTGFTGRVKDGIIMSENDVTSLLRDHITQKPMTLVSSACTGACYAKIMGPGVMKTNCTSRTWPIDSEMLRSPNASWGNWKTHVPTGLGLGLPNTLLPAFEIRISPVHDWPTGGEAAMMTVGMASWFDLEGEYVETSCYLLPAIVEYDVMIKGNVVSLPKRVDQGRVLRLANNTRALLMAPAAMGMMQLDTMDALTIDAQIALTANLSVIRNGASPPSVPYVQNVESINLMSSQYLNASNHGYDLNFLDPMPDIVSTFNQLMFRGGVIASNWNDLRSRVDPQNITTTLLDPGISIHQTVSAVQEITQNVFDSDLRWYAGAAIVQVVTALVILPMLWGWWSLGYHHTLSPFAIALAFDAPVLKDVNSAAGAKGVVDMLGSMKLKYGIVNDSNGHDGRPQEQEGFASGRLGVGESRGVTRPRKGVVFLE
ncbi:hypothetical protein LTR37_000451 [Vermiconidia calcicola]|uniref:Uncharacterized protein n=1 Tax=Vermiconidia calcicola TaxID=1690605 RepID=A0ACC3P1E7_9PEZI|nr:hypothetical protein LTR37_000451 [Vermiconidia calcicola]